MHEHFHEFRKLDTTATSFFSLDDVVCENEAVELTTGIRFLRGTTNLVSATTYKRPRYPLASYPVEEGGEKPTDV
jgi:hypothetical protein